MVSIKEEDEEDEEPHTQQQNHIHHHHYSEEEEEEAKPEMESESSPLRSPIQSHSHSKSFSKHHPEPLQSINSQPHENLSQIIAMDRQIHGFSPLRSPPLAPPPQNHNNNNNTTTKKKKPIRPPPPLPLPLEPTPTPMDSVQVNPLSPVIVVNRSIREDLSVVSKMDPGENGFPGGAPPPPGAGSRRVRSDVEYGDRRSRRVSSILYQERKEARLKRAALGFRVCEAVFCLISFSVMAADKTQGWAGDSFDRYKEYRYCLSVTVIGFAYAGFQAFDLAYNLVSGTHVMQDHIRIYSDFFMDQVLTYLLISASSAAASRVDEWQSNWGKDEFTIMASASIGMSFLAFVAFAFSSLISGHNLCTYNSQT